MYHLVYVEDQIFLCVGSSRCVSHWQPGWNWQLHPSLPSRRFQKSASEWKNYGAGGWGEVSKGFFVWSLCMEKERKCLLCKLSSSSSSSSVPLSQRNGLWWNHLGVPLWTSFNGLFNTMPGPSASRHLGCNLKGVFNFFVTKCYNKLLLFFCCRQ